MMTSRAIYAIVLTACLVPADLGWTAGQQQTFPFVGQITTDQVNIRAGQSANFERVCQLGKGAEVLVVEKQFSWYKIQLPPQAKCYIHKEYVQFLGQGTGGILADEVNIRAGAGIHFTVLGQVNKGETVVIEEELDDWYRIRPIPESYGWVTDDFLVFKSADTAVFKPPLAQSKPENQVAARADIPEIITDEPRPSQELTDIETESKLTATQDVIEPSGIDVAPKTVPPAAAPPKAVIEQNARAGKILERGDKGLQPKLRKTETPSPAAEQFEYPENGILSVVGYVEPFERKGEDSIFYKIVQEGQPVCFVQGPNQMLGRFMHQKVAVEGVVEKKFLTKYNVPVLTVSKIRLMI